MLTRLLADRCAGARSLPALLHIAHSHLNLHSSWRGGWGKLTALLGTEHICAKRCCCCFLSVPLIPTPGAMGFACRLEMPWCPAS
jgi:hypothetical protein